MKRPEANEYLPLAEQYVSLVPDGDIKVILEDQHDRMIAFLQELSEEQAAYRYAEGKWSLKTLIGHIADVERLWNYRILRIVRGDVRELPGYDRDIFAVSAPFDKLPIIDVLKDFSAVRQSTLSLIRHLPGEAFSLMGDFQNHSFSALAMTFIIAGHETHHLNVIKARYLL